MVQAGDSIPSIPLVEGAPDKTVDLAAEFGNGSGLIIGVPAAFSEYLPREFNVASNMANCHSKIVQF